MTNKLDSSLDRLLHWLQKNGWDGFDPLEIPDYFVRQRSKQKILSKEERFELLERERKEPLVLRKELGIQPKRTSASLAMLLHGYALLYSKSKDNAHLDEALKLATWLETYPCGGYSNLCYGHPFNRESVMFIPQDTPTAVVSCTVGDAFLALFESCGDERYLDDCRSICSFITQDLRRDEMGHFGLCFSYTPFDDYHIHMANLMTAAFLRRVSKITDDQEYLDLSQRAIAYTLSEQDEAGAIGYWGQMQSHYQAFHPDFLHVAISLDRLFILAYQIGDDYLRAKIEPMLSDFLTNYFNADGLPISPGQDPQETDIRLLAESITVFSHLSEKHPELKERAKTLADWAIDEMQTDEGWFIWKKSKTNKTEIPLMRWGQASMFRAIADYRLAKKI